MKILYIDVDLATTVEIAGPYSTLLGYRQLSRV